MPRAAVIGQASRVAGFELAGALVFPADDETAAREALRSLPRDVQVVVVTASVARWLGEELAQPDLLPAVMPG
jgi:vacuolar-type H+-ATPase subunit F/Vma7